MGDKPGNPGFRIRRSVPGDARAIIEVHHLAVRGLAAGDYPADIIGEWAPWPVTNDAVMAYLDSGSRSDEITFVAAAGDRIIGMASMVPSRELLGACYVSPDASRTGVGSALVRAVEGEARALGLASLVLDASLTAEPFYAALGYAAVAPGLHTLASGRAMDCILMRKVLR